MRHTNPGTTRRQLHEAPCVTKRAWHRVVTMNIRAMLRLQGTTRRILQIFMVLGAFSLQGCYAAPLLLGAGMSNSADSTTSNELGANEVIETSAKPAVPTFNPDASDFEFFNPCDYITEAEAERLGLGELTENTVAAQDRPNKECTFQKLVNDGWNARTVSIFVTPVMMPDDGVTVMMVDRHPDAKTPGSAWYGHLILHDAACAAGAPTEGGFVEVYITYFYSISEQLSVCREAQLILDEVVKYKQ